MRSTNLLSRETEQHTVLTFSEPMCPLKGSPQVHLAPLLIPHVSNPPGVKQGIFAQLMNNIGSEIAMLQIEAMRNCKEGL